MLVLYGFLLAIPVLLFLGRLFRKKSTDGRSPPGPFQLPILGYLPWIDPERPHQSLTRLARRYGPVCRLRMGSVNTILLSDPRLVRQALAKEAFAGRAPLYLTHGIMQGYGLICAEGELWRNQRKFVAGCLRNFGAVKHGPSREKMERRILEAVNECITKLDERSGPGGIDPLDTLHHCMGNLVNGVVFGKTYGEDDRVWKWLRQLQEDGVKEIGVAGPLNFLPFLRYVPRFGRTMRSLIEGKEKTHEIYRAILEEHRSGARVDPECFLAAFDQQMRSNEERVDGPFTEPQLYHLLADLFGAGTDTTLTTLRWFLLFMAAHPEEQERIQAEIDKSLGGKAVSLEDREALPGLEAGIAEVQRLRSVTPLGIPHGTTEDTRIGEYRVPKGTMIVPLQWAIHTDPIYWDSPLEFRPERFRSEDGGLLKPEAFLPFQTGKRMCVGDELAKMMLFLFAGRILDAFSVAVAPGTSIDLEGECGITLVPRPHRLIFARRR